jgi:DNA polymerase III epsilon subunit-like protein
MNNKKTLIFLDFEFTGLHIKTTPISIGLITDCGHKFYAEFNDYDKTQCDEWINENVINKLSFNDYIHYLENNKDEKIINIKNDKKTISESLNIWLKQFKNIEFWGDSVSYDWLLFIDLIGMGKTMRKLPNNFESHQAYDIHTVLKINYHKPKENRHIILGIENKNQHNSLYDAEITMKLHEKFVKK